MEENRIKHINSVAQLMKTNANILGLNIEEMFTLGYLHDIGYEFGDNSNHAEIGGKILQNMNYKYYKEVKFHGAVCPPYKSIQLDLLNFCDMHTDGKGSYVSFEERLNDIKNRRGENSKAYKDCVIIIENLKKNEKLSMLDYNI